MEINGNRLQSIPIHSGNRRMSDLHENLEAILQEDMSRDLPETTIIADGFLQPSSSPERTHTTQADDMDQGYISDSSDISFISSQSSQDLSRKSMSWYLARIFEFELKVMSQITGLKTLQGHENLSATFTESDGFDFIHSRLALLEDEWHRFTSTNDSFTQFCTVDVLTSSYVQDNIYDQAYTAYIDAKLNITTLINKINISSDTFKINTQLNSQHSVINLPSLNIKPFSGDYGLWPEFKKTFMSLVINNVGLAPVQRLHYLQTSLTGSAASIIAHFPMCNSQFIHAWNKLLAKYDNHRLFISAHLDRLLNIPKISYNSTAQLQQFIDSASESITALKGQQVILGESDEILLTHLLISKLDRYTQKAWNTTLRSSTDYPTFKQLSKFLADRSRSQERFNTSSHNTGSNHNHIHRINSSKQDVASSSTLVDSQHPSRHLINDDKPLRKATANQYPCELCKASHFIVHCPQFNKFTSTQRALVVINKGLCPNCLGRHILQSCKTALRCKVCHLKHHTMIHHGLVHVQSTNQPTSAQD
ncbi:uncharacterized protein LOC123265490 [Cotesia glomerata]|uniref:uncharacterized protein LOC123265490 n=1 Tax=Cotesia glomerata TaxID=32391 RepID=UPI001D010C73|nr:uncharacterized protein LOC123265490 [Cotesia glomerata]XP_044585214.1 uncharacterized protein LOC123265490 [Cotesia glomerata]